MKWNKLHRPKKVLSLVAVALLFALVACSAPAPASIPEPEDASACPTEPMTDSSTPSAEPSSRLSPSEMVPRITIAELQQKMESKADILIVDNRSKEEYDVDHIKGAVLAPLSVMVAGEWTLPLDKELIFYCS